MGQRTYKSCRSVNIDNEGRGLSRKLFDRSNDVNSVRLANELLGNCPLRLNADRFLN